MKIRALRILLAVIIISFAVAQGWAQSRYSLNAVGYFDVSFVAGSNLVANPLNSQNNTISNLFRGVPDGSFFLPYDGPNQTFGPRNFYSSANGWTDPGALLLPPKGGFLWLPTATQIAFVGEVWLRPTFASCQTYPFGYWVLSMMPGGTVFCNEFAACRPTPPQGTTLSKWNRASQSYQPPYHFIGQQPGYETGWTDDNFNPADPQLEPTESALFSVPDSFSVCGAAVTTQSVARVSLQNPRRDGTNVTFRLAWGGSLHYELLRSENLKSNSWSAVEERIVDATNGYAILNAPIPPNEKGFYRLSSVWSAGPPSLINPSRSGTQFTFQFFGIQGTNYNVQKKSSLSQTSWQAVATVTGTNGLMTVNDSTATASSGYYRLQY